MQKLSFDRAWRFRLGDPPATHWQDPNDAGWRTVDLPHDWSIELERLPDAPSQASGGYFQMGRGCYRKTFEASPDWAGKHVSVEFEGVYMNAEVWLNGNLLGRHPYGYTTFTCDLTPHLKPAEDNVLLVTVDNDCQLNSRWYSGSGIYRHVWLLVASPVHVAHWGTYVTTPDVTPERATVRAEVTVANESDTDENATLLCHVVTPEGLVLDTAERQITIGAGDRESVTAELAVPSPLLWSPETPHLYQLETELAQRGKVIDMETTAFGIRTLRFDPEVGFLLNGQETKLRGGCVHHDNGVMGAEAHDRSEERKVELHKASGYNAIRCAHNPPSPAFLDACDRLGILVIDEAFDCWREGKNPYDYHVAFPDWWQRDLDSMLYRDRNHPSIVIWSIGNEIGERNGSSDGAWWARALADHVHAIDPTRPVTAAICTVGADADWPTTDSVFAALDIGGYNYQKRQYRADQARHPQRLMAGTESTAGEAFEHWMSVEQLPYVIGDFVWTSMDYLGEAGIGRVYYDPELKSFLGEYPWHQANCGDLDLCGFKRPQSYYRDILWSAGSPLYIAVHDPGPGDAEPKLTYWGWPDVWPNWTWPGHEGETFKVDVYAACDKVELRLNGQSLGVQPTGPSERFIATFAVPYQPGALHAIGYRDEDVVAEHEIHTVGSPVSIRLTPDRSDLTADGGDLSFITVEVVDRAGRVNPQADNTIYFTVLGEGTLAAVGSGDPKSTESYRGHHRSVYRGRCLAVVRTTGAPGPIILRAMADGLDVAEVELQAMA